MITSEWRVLTVVKDDFKYGLPNVVRDVTFQLRVFKDGGRMQEIHFACAIPPPEGKFIPFEELTDQHYYEWLEKLHNPKSFYEEHLAKMIF